MFFVASRAVTDFPVAVAEDVAFCCIALRVASLVCSANVTGFVVLCTADWSRPRGMIVERCGSCCCCIAASVTSRMRSAVVAVRFCFCDVVLRIAWRSDTGSDPSEWTICFPLVSSPMRSNILGGLVTP